MLLYQIIHIESGKRYIGQTTRPFIERYREHVNCLRKGKHQNRYLQSAWTKHGESAFKFEIIEEFSSLDALNKAEMQSIKTGINLYNLSDGGGGHIHSNKAKRAIGEANKIPIVGMNVKTGEIRHYPSAADSMKNGFNQKCVRKCAVGCVSKRKNGITFESISHKGWVWVADDESAPDKLKEKAKKAKRAKVRLERPVIGLNVHSKKTVQFKSCAEAGRNGFGLSLVHKACNRISAVHHGFVWCYLDVTDPQSLLEKKRKYVFSKARKRKNYNNFLLKESIIYGDSA